MLRRIGIGVFSMSDVDSSRRPIKARSSGWAQRTAIALSRLNISPNQISVKLKNNPIISGTNNDTVTLSVVCLQLERMENLLFKCRLLLSDSRVSPENADNKADNCVASISLQIDALQKNKNDVLFIKSTNGKYLVNNLRNVFAKLKNSQGTFSEYLFNRVMLELDANKILSQLPYYIEKNLVIGSKAIENGESATNVYVIMRQAYVLQRLEENTRKILNLKTGDSVGPISDYIGRDAALFVRVSDALVNSNSRMYIKAVNNLKLNKELSDLKEKFNTDISLNVGKMLDLIGQYSAYIQAKEDMRKYLDKMLGDVDYLRSKYRQTLSSGELI